MREGADGRGRGKRGVVEAVEGRGLEGRGQRGGEGREGEGLERGEVRKESRGERDMGREKGRVEQ